MQFRGTYSSVDDSGCGMAMQRLQTVEAGALDCPVEHRTVLSISNHDICSMAAQER